MFVEVEVDDRRKRNFSAFDNSSIELLQTFRKEERYSLPFQFTDDVVSDCDGDEERINETEPTVLKPRNFCRLIKVLIDH